MDNNGQFGDVVKEIAIQFLSFFCSSILIAKMLVASNRQLLLFLAVLSCFYGMQSFSPRTFSTKNLALSVKLLIVLLNLSGTNDLNYSNKSRISNAANMLFTPERKKLYPKMKLKMNKE